MKIQFDKTGAVPIQPDFEMLCASLIGIQAMSPTVLAEAIKALGEAEIQASFHRPTARRPQDDES